MNGQEERMEPTRQLAVDPPTRSAAATTGRHLLGRLYKEDPRDWSLLRLIDGLLSDFGEVCCAAELPR